MGRRDWLRSVEQTYKVIEQVQQARTADERCEYFLRYASSEINEVLMRQLHRCEFVDEANNVVLVGGPGTGKTHVATAIISFKSRKLKP